MFNKKTTLVATIASLLLTACGGGGGGGGGNDVPGTLSGKAVDGYLKGAVALCDSNNNGIADTGESTTLTDEFGGFTFSSLCTSTIVIKGGTSIDTGLPFKGVLKGPVSSSIVTPLTSLMVSGLGKEQINSALGLSGESDVTKLDPALASSAGTLANPDLMKKTLAVQQLLQQTTSMIAALGKDTTASAIQAVYIQVTNAAAETISSNPGVALINANGTVNESIVNTIVRLSATKVSLSSDPALGTVKQWLGNYSAGSIAELIAPAIAAQAEKLATSNYSKELTKSLQSNPVVANAASQLAEILETGIDGMVDLTQAGRALREVVIAQMAANAPGQTSALALLSNHLAAQASLAGIHPSYDLGTLYDHKNYFAILRDEIAVNGEYYSIHELLNGLTISRGDMAALASIGFTLDIKGTPIPPNHQGVKTITVSMGYEISEMIGPNSRVLQVIIDKVDATIGNDGNLIVSIPANARLYTYGKNSKGAEVNLTLTNLEPNTLTVVNNEVRLDMVRLYELLEHKFENEGQEDIFYEMINSTGTFYFKFLMTQIDIRKCDSEASYAPFLSIQVPHSGQHPISGFGAEGIINVQ